MMFFKFSRLNKLKKNKHIGLALGGGAVLGAAHIGVIRALEEAEIKISYITGTSIGAVIASLYAFDKSWQEIKNIALEVKWLEISGMKISKYGLLSNDKIGELISSHLGPVNIEDSSIPLAVVATDISHGKKIMLDHGRLSTAVKASACLPGIYAPIEYNDSLLIDGGIMENIPVPSLEKLGAEYTIGVDLFAKHNFQKPENIFELLINTVDLTMVNARNIQAGQADLLIEPDLARFNIYDTDQISDLIEQGYISAKKTLNMI